jgi:gas vesicle protein
MGSNFEPGGFQMSRNVWPQVVSAFAIGLGAGAALGVLFAPQSGDDTRGYLKDSAQGAVDDAVAQGRRAVRKARKSVSDVADFAGDVADTAETAFRDARNASS